MIHIRTAEALARAIETPPDYKLRTLLAARAVSLADYSEYDFSELMEIVIVQVGDRLPDIERSYGEPMVAEGLLAFPVESIVRNAGWYEALWIKSDDGFGLVLYVQDHPMTDAALRSACAAALRDGDANGGSRNSSTV